MKRIIDKYRYLLPVIVLFIVLQVLFYAPRLNSDGAYYFEYARSLILQNDLNFDDEREFFTWEWVPVFRDYLPGDWDNTGYPPNIFSFGPAIFWLPFFCLAHWIAIILNLFGGDFGVSGYGLLYRFLPMMSSVLAGLGAIFIIDMLAAEGGYRAKDRGAALFLILGASHWPAFIFVTPAFSHSISILAVSAFYLVWFRSRDADWHSKEYALYGILAGISVLARWQNAFCLILPLCDAIAALLSYPTGAAFKKRLSRWISFSISFMIVISPQLIVTWILYGKPITDPQGEGGMLWGSPRFSLILFNGIKGLYSVNPILFIATVCIILIVVKNPRLGWGAILVFVVQLYINAVRRDWAGVGFGMRRFLNLTPIFALGLIALFDQLRQRNRILLRILLWFAGLAAIVWNCLLMAQYYYSELGAPWTSFPASKMIRHQLTEAPKLLLKLISTGLISSGLAGNPAKLVLGITAVFITLLFAYFICRKKSVPHNRPSVIIIILIAVILLDSWLIIGAVRAKHFYSIEFVPGKTFGQLRKLTLNPRSGYYGSMGGLVFSPGTKMGVLKATPHYITDRFIELGTMKTNAEYPYHPTNQWTQVFRSPLECNNMLIISRTKPAEIITDTVVVNVSLSTAQHGQLHYQLRHGFETGFKPPSNTRGNVTALIRDFPAVNRIASRNIVDYRAIFQLPENVLVNSITLHKVFEPVHWEVHGIAFF